MKAYSIFEKTMADMTYREIEDLVEKEAVVLFPIGVMEEHGPHLPLGTDTYLVYSLFRHIQEELDALNIPSVIAPPFYWGLNIATAAFPGSFTVKPDTMKAVLKDTIECLDKWGFKKVFMYNIHGDNLHGTTILDVCRENHESGLGIDVYDIVPEFCRERFGLKGDEPYAVIQVDNVTEEDEGQTEDQPKEEQVTYMDVHAGGIETSMMLVDFEGLVNQELAKTLESSKTSFEMLRKWAQGGDEAREITPNGYCGDPSDLKVEEVKEYFKDISVITADLIKEKVQKA